MNYKKGFTLAELMLVFTVIGVLSAILIPALFSAMPDHKILKAKKAYNTLVRAVETLTNDSIYTEHGGSFYGGNFFKISDTSATDYNKELARARAFFCSNLVEVINVKSSNCTRTDGVKDLNSSYKNQDLTVVNSSNSEVEVKADTKEFNELLDYNFVHLQGTEANNYLDENSLDYFCRDYFVDNSENFKDNPPKDTYSFITGDNTGWIIQKNTFREEVDNFDGRITVMGKEVPLRYTLICVNTGDLKKINSDDIYGIGVNEQGKIIVGGKLQSIIDDELSDKK